MSDRNAMLDICDVAGDGGNLWFVSTLLGAIGLNLVLTCVLGACMLRGRGGGKAKGDEEAFDDVQGSVAKGALFDAGGGGSGGGGGGADLKRELLLFKRQLDAMDKKIDNKRVNEITASYLLHNAHDAIGNHVPTAAQVTLDQIGSHQFFIKQRVEDIDKRMQAMEASINRIMIAVNS